MRKSLIYIGIGCIVAVGAAALWFTFTRTKLCIEDILALHQDDGKYSNLVINYPLDEALFRRISWLLRFIGVTTIPSLRDG